MVEITEAEIMNTWKNNNVVVSIDTLSYNHAKYISQCLDGLLKQRTNFAFEILVCDDASTDDTAKLIHEYEEKYPNIVVPLYQIENKYSKGIKMSATYQFPRAKGKYIAICEGDDYWIDENKLQMQVDFLENNPEYGMCYTKAKQYIQSKQKFNKKSVGDAFDGFEDLLKNGNRIPTLTTVYRKDLLDKYEKEIQPSNKGWLMGDYPMWLYFSHESEIKFIDKDTAAYRVLENSASHSVDVEKQFRFNKNIYNIREFYSKKYDISIEEHDDEKELFYIYYRKNIKRYSSKNCIEMKNCLKKIKFKTKKEYIVSYVCGNRLFFILFRLFVSLFNWVKKC